jgi:hypothetical protein
MRSLKVYRNNYINGVKLKIGAWYKIKIDNNDFWVVRFYSIESNKLNHMYNAYVIYSDNTMHDYPPLNGVYHPLCEVVDIMEIELVSLEWVKSLGINC